VVLPDGADPLVAVPPPGPVCRGDSDADALGAGVDDEAGLWPVIWIKPHTTTTEQINATTMITVTHRVLRVLRAAIRPVCGPRAATPVDHRATRPRESGPDCAHLVAARIQVSQRGTPLS
jgi:hypothetical protein